MWKINNKNHIENRAVTMKNPLLQWHEFFILPSRLQILTDVPWPATALHRGRSRCSRDTWDLQEEFVSDHVFFIWLFISNTPPKWSGRGSMRNEATAPCILLTSEPVEQHYARDFRLHKILALDQSEIRGLRISRWLSWMGEFSHFLSFVEDLIVLGECSVPLETVSPINLIIH